MIDAFNKLTSFLDRLDEVRIHYTVGYKRENAIMVMPRVPGERWEIEFFQDGSVEIEVFRSGGKIWGEEKLPEFISKFVDIEMNS